ncbi:MAG: sn-glycerol-3-phosphate ABC transporter ATP-binding protein UgpC [Rhodospirillales bacterium]|nr:sn-glycerol-3-phosphate ABC transporter ATP-binding protein UgpC [Rhodospirillales bacterium]
MATLRLSKVNKKFDDVHVIHDVDLLINDGEFVVFVGPSGCGKSTLLRMVAGLEKVTSGEIEIDGQIVNDISAAERGLAMVFQSYALYPHMTVYQNMAFGLENHHMPRPEIEARVREAAQMLRIEEYLGRKPKALSGGQRQRVAIGRAIVRKPRIFLLDEPLSNLDAELRVIMRAELTNLHSRLSATMIHVTHDQVEAMTLADKIVVLRDGVVEQVGPPLDLYNAPDNQFVAGFIGSPKMNFLPARLKESVAAGVVVSIGDMAEMTLPFDGAGLSAGQPLTVGIRPEHVHHEPGDGAVITGRVTISEQLGGESYLYCDLAEDRKIIIHAPGQSDARRGDEIGMSFPAELTYLFDDKERAVPKKAAA